MNFNIQIGISLREFICEARRQTWLFLLSILVTLAATGDVRERRLLDLVWVLIRVEHFHHVLHAHRVRNAGNGARCINYLSTEVSRAKSGTLLLHVDRHAPLHHPGLVSLYFQLRVHELNFSRQRQTLTFFNDLRRLICLVNAYRLAH